MNEGVILFLMIVAGVALVVNCLIRPSTDEIPEDIDDA